jgi:hypothetical protein
MKLRECTWWPKITKNDQDIPSGKVRDDGILDTCKILSGDLIIEVDYNGRTVEGRVANNLNGPNVERVKYFLVDYYGELMATVEDLDVRPISSELAKGAPCGA